MTLTEFRKANDVSQREMAFRCGVHQTTIARIERGELSCSASLALALLIATDGAVESTDLPLSPTAKHTIPHMLAALQARASRSMIIANDAVRTHIHGQNGCVSEEDHESTHD